MATTTRGSRSSAHPQGGSQFHGVQFYSKDSFLLDQLIQFLRPAIASGQSVVLIATASHRDNIFSRLRSCGTEFALAVAQERFLLLDAEETLAKFMVNGRPDPSRFAFVLGSRMVRLSAASRPQGQVVAFGEMVACLMERGRRDAALELEQLWNQLATKYAFQLLCAYPIHLFSRPEDRESLLKVCAEHSHVLPGERQASDSAAQEGIHSVLGARQRVRGMEAEIREFRKAEERDPRPKNSTRNTLAGVIAQQLSGPLEAIVNTVYLAGQQPELAEKTRHYLSIADRELERVSRIVQQMVETERRRREAGSPNSAGD